MRKVLRIISLSAGIVSVVSAVILGYVYLEDAAVYTKKLIAKNKDRIIKNKHIGE